jgi:hypothetical protein
MGIFSRLGPTKILGLFGGNIPIQKIVRFELGDPDFSLIISMGNIYNIYKLFKWILRFFLDHGWVLVHLRWLGPHSNSCNSSNYLKIFTVPLTPLLYSSCEFYYYYYYYCYEW